MRIIDADDFYKPFEKGKKTLEAIGGVLPEELLDAVLKIYDEIEERLDATPTIDAVEVVRCKDCKYMTEHYDTDGNVPYWTCSEWDSGTDYDGFCHLAERRSDGTD